MYIIDTQWVYLPQRQVAELEAKLLVKDAENSELRLRLGRNGTLPVDSGGQIFTCLFLNKLTSNFYTWFWLFTCCTCPDVRKFSKRFIQVYEIYMWIREKLKSTSYPCWSNSSIYRQAVWEVTFCKLLQWYGCCGSIQKAIANYCMLHLSRISQMPTQTAVEYYILKVIFN